MKDIGLLSQGHPEPRFSPLSSRALASYTVLVVLLFKKRKIGQWLVPAAKRLQRQFSDFERDELGKCREKIQLATSHGWLVSASLLPPPPRPNTCVQQTDKEADSNSALEKGNLKEIEPKLTK